MWWPTETRSYVKEKKGVIVELTSTSGLAMISGWSQFFESLSSLSFPLEDNFTPSSSMILCQEIRDQRASEREVEEGDQPVFLS
jgi:hypothetical protein